MFPKFVMDENPRSSSRPKFESIARIRVLWCLANKSL